MPIKCVKCPLCSKLPRMLIGVTAIHEDDECIVFMWDITMTLDELLTDVGFLGMDI